MPELSQEEFERAKLLIEREEARKTRQKEYRQNRKDNPEVQAKQKAYNVERRAKEKVRRDALNVLASRHRSEFDEILATMV